ncbi:hypothetical protein BSKO_02769 [Bryopsis sp. KO-2023]|nr:hypothetical protein BSKO_02769 [Bryopsis sp. KO-2023]
MQCTASTDHVVGVTSLWAVEEAQAVAVPYQESIKRKQMTSTAHSASGYAMEGTKKGGIFLLGKVTAAIFIIQFKVKIKIPREGKKEIEQVATVEVVDFLWVLNVKKGCVLVYQILFHSKVEACPVSNTTLQFLSEENWGKVSSPCCKFLYPLSRQMSSSSKGNGQENHPLAKIIELITKQRSRNLRKANEKSSQEGVAAARQLASALDIAGTGGDRGLDLRPDIEDHVPDPGPDAGDGHTPMTDAKDETDAGDPSVWDGQSGLKFWLGFANQETFKGVPERGRCPAT